MRGHWGNSELKVGVTERIRMQNDVEKRLDRVMRLPEISVSLGVSARSVRRMTDRGELPRLVRVGRAVGLMQSDVEAFLERMREQRGNFPQRSKI
jgi:excisionase family DNA binding protein